MDDKSKGYSSQEEDEENKTNEEENEEDEENDRYVNINSKNNKYRNNKINNKNNNNNNNEKNKGTNINIIMAETEKDQIIIQLKKELKEKELQIKSVTKTNNKLQQSLEKFSKQIDDKIFNEKNNKNFFENLKNKKISIKYNSNERLKERELNNAINMIKILRNDNERLQSNLDNYEKNNKIQDLENINRQKMNENNDLEKEIKILKEQINEYKNYIKKNKELEKQIDILNKENKFLKDNIKNLNNQLFEKNQKEENSENKLYITPKKKKISLMKLEKTNNIFNNKYKININPLNIKRNKKNQNTSSLPSININSPNAQSLSKNNSLSKIFLYKKNYNTNIDDILPLFFTQEEIDLINNKLFKNNSQGLEEFKLKLCILNKSKETLSNKYNNEIKKYKERLKSAQEQIDYLNTKIRELEVNCQVLQTQKNEDVIRKRLLQKKIKNLEKNLEEKINILKLGFAGDDINIINNENENENDNENENENENENKMNESQNEENNSLYSQYTENNNNNNEIKKEDLNENNNENNENSFTKEDN